jgi:hypothetical protein
VHLVIEYMDGGSLEDIVTTGGCQDENVLADLSFQVTILSEICLHVLTFICSTGDGWACIST